MAKTTKNSFDLGGYKELLKAYESLIPRHLGGHGDIGWGSHGMLGGPNFSRHFGCDRGLPWSFFFRTFTFASIPFHSGHRIPNLVVKYMSITITYLVSLVSPDLMSFVPMNL